MTRRVKILVAISDFVGGGAERETVNLLRRLDRSRFEPHVAIWRPVFDYSPPDDVPIHVVPKSRPWHVVPAIQRLSRLIDDLRPDLVFSQLSYVSLVAGTAVAQSRWRPKWIFRLAGNPERDLRFPLRSWAKTTLARADLGVGCSEGVTRSLVRHLGLSPARTATLPNIVDVLHVEAKSMEPAPIEKRDGCFTLVHAGRFVRQKNQELLLRAFQRLEGRDAELWMLGRGRLRASLERLAVRLGVEKRIRWLDFQANPFPLFREADAFALSSDYEGLPNVVTESMLCGTPVVSTRCPFGPEEQIEDGVDGLLTRVGDVADFAGALARLADDAALREKLRTQAPRSARRLFETDATCRLYEETFLRVTDVGPAARVPIVAEAIGSGAAP